MNFTKPLKNTFNHVKHLKKDKIDLLVVIEKLTNQRAGSNEFFRIHKNPFFRHTLFTEFLPHPYFLCNFGRRNGILYTQEHMWSYLKMNDVVIDNLDWLMIQN